MDRSLTKCYFDIVRNNLSIIIVKFQKHKSCQNKIFIYSFTKPAVKMGLVQLYNDCTEKVVELDPETRIKNV